MYACELPTVKIIVIRFNNIINRHTTVALMEGLVARVVILIRARYDANTSQRCSYWLFYVSLIPLSRSSVGYVSISTESRFFKTR